MFEYASFYPFKRTLVSVSGHVPEVPVVSVKSGLVFERRLIEHEIEEHGVCPVTKEPLSLEDLIEIQIDKVHPSLLKIE